MSYGWWKFIHLAGVVGFVAAHGTSMAATMMLRRFKEPQQVAGILQLSATTVSAFYVSTVVLLVGGVGASALGARVSTRGCRAPLSNSEAGAGASRFGSAGVSSRVLKWCA